MSVVFGRAPSRTIERSITDPVSRTIHLQPKQLSGSKIDEAPGTSSVQDSLADTTLKLELRHVLIAGGTNPTTSILYLGTHCPRGQGGGGVHLLLSFPHVCLKMGAFLIFHQAELSHHARDLLQEVLCSRMPL